MAIASGVGQSKARSKKLLPDVSQGNGGPSWPSFADFSGAVVWSWIGSGLEAALQAAA